MTSDSINGFYKKSVTRPIKAGFQKHHLIPVQLLKKPSFLTLFEYAEKAGFNSRDFRENGICLPAKERLSVESGRPLHRGPHPRYNELVSDRLAQIELSWKKDNDQHDAKSIAYRLHYLQRGLRRALLKKPRSIMLNKRDPMSRTINFTSLDNEVDIIWLSLNDHDKNMKSR